MGEVGTVGLPVLVEMCPVVSLRVGTTVVDGLVNKVVVLGVAILLTGGFAEVGFGWTLVMIILVVVGVVLEVATGLLVIFEVVNLGVAAKVVEEALVTEDVVGGTLCVVTLLVVGRVDGTTDWLLGTRTLVGARVGFGVNLVVDGIRLVVTWVTVGKVDFGEPATEAVVDNLIVVVAAALVVGVTGQLVLTLPIGVDA